MEYIVSADHLGHKAFSRAVFMCSKWRRSMTTQYAEVDYSLLSMEVGRNDRLSRTAIEKHSCVSLVSNLNQTRVKRHV